MPKATTVISDQGHIRSLVVYLGVLLAITLTITATAFVALSNTTMETAREYKVEVYRCAIISSTAVFLIVGATLLAIAQSKFIKSRGGALFYLRFLTLINVCFTLGSMTTFVWMLQALGNMLQLTNELPPLMVQLPAYGVILGVLEVLFVFTPFV